MDIPQFNHPPVEGHPDCFQYLIVTNKAINLHIEVCVLMLKTYVFLFLY